VTYRLTQHLLLSYPVHWARSAIDRLGKRHPRPELVIVINATRGHLSDPHIPSIAGITGFATATVFHALWDTLEEVGSGTSNYIKEFSEQGLEIRTMHHLLRQYYSAIEVVIVPSSKEEKELYDRRLKGLYNLLHNRETSARADRSMGDLQQQVTQEVRLLANTFSEVRRT
jgi:hypothetical protein